MNSPSIRPILGKTDFPFSFVRIHRFTVSEKDVSLSLEMTRGRGSPRIVFHTAPYVCNFCQTRFSPCCEGLAPLRGTLSCAFGAALLQGPARWGLSHIVFHTVVTLSAPARHLPLEGKAAIRDYHPLKKAAHHPCEPIRSPSTVIPSAAEGSLLHCRHMHTCALTQTPPWCFLFRLSLTHGLPVCKKDPSTSVGMTFKGNG